MTMETTTAARESVLRQLRVAYERLAVQEQMTRTPDPDTADDFHRFGLAVLRALDVEERDPEPPEPNWHDCSMCMAFYARGGR